MMVRTVSEAYARNAIVDVLEVKCGLLAAIIIAKHIVEKLGRVRVSAPGWGIVAE